MAVEIPTIDPPVNPPSRGSPGPIFRPIADAFMQRWPAQINQLRVTVQAMNAAGELIEQQAADATAAKVASANAAALANAAAASALGAPGTYATSADTRSIAAVAAAGVISGAMSAGKLYIPGLTLLQAPPAPNAANQIIYRLETYNPANGDFTGTVISSQGSGTFSNWNIGLTSSILLPIASKEDVWAGTDNGKVVTSYVRAEANKIQPLTDAPNINWNAATQGFHVKVVLGGNRIVATPTGMREGEYYAYFPVQPATGGPRTNVLPAVWDFGQAGTPTLSTGANKMDAVRLQCVDAATQACKATFVKAG